MNLLHWLFGLNSLWCQITRICFRGGTVAPENDNPDDPYQDPSESELVTVRLCRSTGDVSNGLCPDTYEASFLIFNKPTKVCEEHVIPKKFKRAKNKYRHAGFLGIFFWFLNNAWEESNQKQMEWRLVQTLIQMRHRGVSVIDCFLWLSDGKGEHKHLNYKTPYKWIKTESRRKFILSEFDPRFWELVRRFVQITKSVGQMEVCFHAFMDRYGYYPFKYNNEGVSDFWDKDAEQYQVKLLKKLMTTVSSAWGDGYKPWVKICNEPAHWGNHEKFCRIGDWHKRMYFDGVQPYTYIWKTVIDVSHCEGAYDWLNEPRQSDYCGDVRGYEPADRSKEKASVLAEKHALAIPENIDEMEALHYLDSKWCKFKWHGDCGANSNENAEGYRIPGTTFYGPSKRQLKEMLIRCWTEAKRKGKQFYYAYFPVESFSIIDENGDRQWNLWIENYDVDVIDWDIFDAVPEAYDEVYG